MCEWSDRMIVVSSSTPTKPSAADQLEMLWHKTNNLRIFLWLSWGWILSPHSQFGCISWVRIVCWRLLHVIVCRLSTFVLWHRACLLGEKSDSVSCRKGCCWISRGKEIRNSEFPSQMSYEIFKFGFLYIIQNCEICLKFVARISRFEVLFASNLLSSESRSDFTKFSFSENSNYFYFNFFGGVWTVEDVYSVCHWHMALQHSSHLLIIASNFKFLST